MKHSDSVLGCEGFAVVLPPWGFSLLFHSSSSFWLYDSCLLHVLFNFLDLAFYMLLPSL